MIGKKISNKKALAAVQTIIDYCEQQGFCQNCIFRQYGSDHWKCHMHAFDLRDVVSNYKAKKMNRGYID